MFCPQCGAEIASDRVRYCTHCRFPVGSMKEFIVTEVTKSQSEDEKKSYPLRQRDITLGAGLMLIGALKALFLGISSRAPWSEGIMIFLFALGAMFSALLMFSQLSPRQRGLTIGATLMFIGSLLALPVGFATEGLGVLFVAAIFLPIILFWAKIARAFMRIFFDKEVLPEKKASLHPQPALNPTYPPASALPSAQNAPVVEPSTNRMKEAEMVRPFSVTENTTEMLKNKQSLN
ncbi:MAG: zinc ribbon domain-containing protein [Blastocatellia bacterium]